MEWSDEGIVVAARRHGEHAAIVSLLTREHGRHLGLVRGGAGGRHGSTYQPGNLVRARWRARLDEHLGTFSCEPVASYAAAVLDDPLRLAALASVLAIVELACPEREPHPRLFDSTLDLVRALAGAGWAQRYVAWERACLGDLGFGLDLAACAATGQRDDLVFVSPRTGRAVSRVAGAPYADRLLRLPEFLAGDAPAEATADDILSGLDLTGFFLERHVLSPQQRHLPAARKRFVDRWRRHAFARDMNARQP